VNKKDSRIRRCKLALDFYICFNDLCPYFGTNAERAAGYENMKSGTVPVGYYQGEPLCVWCDLEMLIAHTDAQADPPHIEWDGTDPIHGKYYQLHF